MSSSVSNKGSDIISKMDQNSIPFGLACTFLDLVEDRSVGVTVFSNIASLTGIPTVIGLAAAVGNAFFALLAEIGNAIRSTRENREFANRCWTGALGGLAAAGLFLPVVHQVATGILFALGRGEQEE